MLSGIEILTIGGIIVVILVFGSKKIPELARSIGQARRLLRDETAERSSASQPQEEKKVI